jgi:ribose transport system permease protein
MTLAMMQIGDGISAMLVRGQIAYNVPPLIRELGSGRIFNIPWIVIIAATMLLPLTSCSPTRRFGRYVYMVGGNREAGRVFRRQRPPRHRRGHGDRRVCSGIAGHARRRVFRLGPAERVHPYLLDAIAAVVVGGTSLFGGRGGIGNTIVGLFVLGVLNNGLDHVQIDPFLKVLIRGLILLLALVINVYAQRLRATEQAGA